MRTLGKRSRRWSVAWSHLPLTTVKEIRRSKAWKAEKSRVHVGRSPLTRTDLIWLGSRCSTTISRKRFEGLFRCTFVCVWRSSGRMLNEKALMTSSNERYLPISTRISGHSPVDWQTSNVSEVSICSLLCWSTTATKGLWLRCHSSLKARSVSRTFTGVELRPVCGKTRQLSKTRHWYWIEEIGVCLCGASGMIPINTGLWWTENSVSFEVGKISRHHRFSLMNRKSNFARFLILVYLSSFLSKVTSQGQTM